MRCFLVLCFAIVILLNSPIRGLAAELTAREVAMALFSSSLDKPIDFSGKDLSALDLSGLDFKGADLSRANLFGTDLSSSNLDRARLTGARLDRATITGTSFEGSDLSDATILRPNIFSTMEVNARELPNFRNATMVRANISGRLDRISFAGSDLTEAFFGPRDPDGEVLTTARIEMNGCDFTGAKLHRADLSLNNLQYAKFENADLTGANLAGSNLSNADFTGAEISDADFSGALISGANFERAKGIGRAKGLDPAVSRVAP